MLSALLSWDLSSMWRLLLSFVVVWLLAGCAGVLHGHSQTVHITTVCKDQVIPAACAARNNKGLWHFHAPASIEVHKDFSDLSIACKSPYFAEVSASVPSMLNVSVAGNVIAGGIVGAGLDMYTGSGFVYNPVVRIAYPACQ